MAASTKIMQLRTDESTYTFRAGLGLIFEANMFSIEKSVN